MAGRLCALAVVAMIGTGSLAGRAAQIQTPSAAAPAPVVEVRHDWATGDYIISYRAGNDDREYVFTPATLIAPTIATNVTFNGDVPVVVEI